MASSSNINQLSAIPEDEATEITDQDVPTLQPNAIKLAQDFHIHSDDTSTIRETLRDFDKEKADRMDTQKELNHVANPPIYIFKTCSGSKSSKEVSRSALNAQVEILQMGMTQEEAVSPNVGANSEEVSISAAAIPCNRENPQCSTQEVTRIHLKEMKLRPGLGPLTLQELDLVPEDIGLKAPTVSLDYPSPEDLEIRYGSMTLSQEEILKAKVVCSNTISPTSEGHNPVRREECKADYYVQFLRMMSMRRGKTLFAFRRRSYLWLFI